MKFQFNYKLFYVIILVGVIFMFIHIEFEIHRTYAPENLLIRVIKGDGSSEENAQCFGDISSDEINIEAKKFQPLDSLYSFIDPDIFYSYQGEKGFYLLETGFNNYYGYFEIKITCYGQDFNEISYIVNSTNTNCEFRQNGRFLIC